MSTGQNGCLDAAAQMQGCSARTSGQNLLTPGLDHRDRMSIENYFNNPLTKLWTSPMAMNSSTPFGPTEPTSTTLSHPMEMCQRNLSAIFAEVRTRQSLTTDFALSALKNSFSMSSLSHQCNNAATPTTPVLTPDNRVKWERQFYSLNRPNRDRGGCSSKKAWRRSFGSSPLTSKEDVQQQQQQQQQGSAGGQCDWPALQNDYTFLMSCDLIESCRSVNTEMSWDNGDLQHLKLNLSTVAATPTHAVDCQTDVEITTTPDLQLQLQILREWLKKMEGKVPKLVLKPKWTIETLGRKTVEFKVLQREIEGRASEFAAIGKKCSPWNPRLARNLETRYHRLLLRILEWAFHLETLATKPEDFWVGRRSASSVDPDPDTEASVILPSKQRRLNEDSLHVQRVPHVNESEQLNETMRQSKKMEGGVGGVLVLGGTSPAPVSPAGANISIYEYKHVDTDNELNPIGANHSSDEEANEWFYSPNGPANRILERETNGSSCSSLVRKKLTFGEDSDASDVDDALSSQSWYRHSDSGDWLHGADLQLSQEEFDVDDVDDAHPTDDLASFKDAYRLVYDKEKVHKLVTAAEQMVSAGSKADVTQQQPTQRNYNTEEGDASSELTSGDESNAEIDTDEAGSSRKVSLNRTFIRPEASFGDAPVVMRNRQRSKAQRPWSLSAVEASSPASWALHSTSETRLDHLGTCGASGASGSAKKPFAGHVATQKDGASPNLNDGSAAALSSGGSTGGGVRQRRRRSSARFRTAQLMLRRGVDIDCCSGSDNNNTTLQARGFGSASALTASVASSHSSGESSAGAGSHRSRRVLKSSTLTQMPLDDVLGADGVIRVTLCPENATEASHTDAQVAEAEAEVGAGAEAEAAVPPKTTVAVLSTLSTPRSAPSDGELGLGHVDETSSFSEQAWDNYLDRYASEAYSEDPPDAESARRLLEFGEDYRNDLDSLSDCPSTMSIPVIRRLNFPHNNNNNNNSNSSSSNNNNNSSIKRWPLKRVKLADRGSLLVEMSDSDSDMEELVHFVDTSTSQYNIAHSTLHKVLSSSGLEPAQFAELLATCRTNVRCLLEIYSQLKMSKNDLEGSIPSMRRDLKPVRDLIDKWEQLELEVTPLHRESVEQRCLLQQLQTLKSKLFDLESLVQRCGTDGDVQLNLKKAKHLRLQVEAEKSSLLEVNVAVHNWHSQLGVETYPAANYLKEEVITLQMIWDQLVKKALNKESELLETERTWLELQQQLNDLQAEIALDQEKVHSFIESRSSNSATPAATQTQVEQCQSSTWMKNWNHDQENMQCDSGISSGSDGEFISTSEREKRLQSLRQLARKLESVLAPGSATLLRMNQTLDQTQQELTLLHNQLSYLPPIPTKKTAIPVPPVSQRLSVKEMSVQTDPSSPPRISRNSTLTTPRTLTTPATSTRKVLPYWWRILRAALPFQVAILVLICAVCSMEPTCCSYLNNFSNSLVPKLSYQGDPPPI